MTLRIETSYIKIYQISTSNVFLSVFKGNSDIYAARRFTKKLKKIERIKIICNHFVICPSVILVLCC